MQENITFVLLIVSLITIWSILILLRKQKKNTQTKKIFIIIINLALWWVVLELLQIIIHSNIEIPNYYDIYLESFASIGKCFLPVMIFLLGLVFARTKVEFNKKYSLLFVIPTLTIVLMLTNQHHNLVYEKYSIYTYETVLGPYAIVHQLYSYGMLGIGMFFLLYYSIKNSGFFSKQSILILIGTVGPVVINALETYKIVKLSVYSTPISFAFAVAIYALAIFKFNFLSVAPIALQRIVDRMSDAYIVVNEEYKITDFNKPFLKKVKIEKDNIRGKNIFELTEKIPDLLVGNEKLVSFIERARNTGETITFEKYVKGLDKYFNIEISSIMNKNTFLGTLILFKDITQHVIDMETIKNNQDLLVEKERLAGLGQMIGGIAHNLKTPIMSISGATEGIIDLIKEYEASVGNPMVTKEDHHEIAKEMYEWIKKIKSYDGYMSDVITAVKGQAVALTENDASKFTIKELLKYVNILMRHELKNALINLKINSEVEEDLKLTGNVNSLVQVINNIVSNAIQAYGKKTNEDILLNISKKNNNLIISVQDFGAGMNKEVQDNLFKKMITTKGKNGTGLGLFMSYSNIKAHFNGNITFKSEKGVGTTFYITIPIR